jgi:hypothetical protein
VAFRPPLPPLPKGGRIVVATQWLASGGSDYVAGAIYGATDDCALRFRQAATQLAVGSANGQGVRLTMTARLDLGREYWQGKPIGCHPLRRAI